MYREYILIFKIIIVEAYVPLTERGIRIQHVKVILGKLEMVAMIVQVLLVVQEIEKKKAVILVMAMVGIGRTEIAEVARVKATDETTLKLAEEVETGQTEKTE